MFNLLTVENKRSNTIDSIDTFHRNPIWKTYGHKCDIR